MTFIDGQGRLFGKVNLIDAAVVTVIASLIPFLLFAHAVFTRPTKTSSAHMGLPATIGVDLWILPAERHEPLVETGEALFNAAGARIGQITELQDAVIPGESKPGRPEKPDPPFQMMTCVLDAMVHEREASLGGVMLKKDSELTVYTSKGSITGVVKRVYLFPPRWLTLTVRFDSLMPELPLAVHEGDVQRDWGGRVVVRIKRVVKDSFAFSGAIPGRELAMGIPDKAVILLSNSTARQLVLDLEAFCTEEGSQYYFYDNDQRVPVKIGSQFSIRTPLYDLTGQVTSISAGKDSSSAMSEQTSDWIEAVIRSDNVAPEVADLVKKGDTETDMSGTPVAVISDVLNIDDAKTLIRPNPESGSLLLADNPTERQLVIQVRLKCFRAGDVAVFKGQQIKIGSTLLIQTPRYDLQGKFVAIASGHDEASSTLGATHQAKWVTVTIQCEDVPPEVAKTVQREDVQEDAARNVIAKIAQVDKRPSQRHFEFWIKGTGDRVHFSEKNDNQDLMVQLKLLTIVRDHTVLFRGKVLKLGQPFVFQTPRYDLEGRIVAIHHDVADDQPGVAH